LELFITFLLVFLGLSIFLWAGTLFLQGYIYSEPASGLFWRAPAAGAAITLLLAFWCFLDYRNPGRYNATWFEPTASDEEVFNKFWSVKGNREILYQAHRDAFGRIEYRDAAGRPWARSDAEGVVEAIIVEEENGDRIRFNAQLTDDKKFKAERGEPVRYVEVDGRSRVMTDRYIGKLPLSHWGTTLATVTLTFLHLGLWFACLWLLLQFQWGNAFGLALVIWLALSLTLVPLIFATTETAVKQRAVSSAKVSRVGEWGHERPEWRAGLRQRPEAGLPCQAEASVTPMRARGVRRWDSYSIRFDSLSQRKNT
jgi:hypothetical protein